MADISYNIANKDETDMTAQTLATHLAEDVSDENGAHGLLTEEGIWTPVIYPGTHSYSTQEGYYYKIGDLVHVWGMVQLSSKESVSGNPEIRGLPFPAKDVWRNAAVSGSISGFSSIPANFGGLILRLGSNDAIRLGFFDTNARTDSRFSMTNLGDTFKVEFSATYVHNATD